MSFCKPECDRDHAECAEEAQHSQRSESPETLHRLGNTEGRRDGDQQDVEHARRGKDRRPSAIQRTMNSMTNASQMTQFRMRAAVRISRVGARLSITSAGMTKIARVAMSHSKT